MTPDASTTSPRPELLALLDAVKDHPDDDTPRLVLADWLDEQDNPLDAERAKFIREDIERDRTGAFSGVLFTNAERTEEAELFRRWLGSIADWATGAFHRGLPTISLTGPKFLKPAFRPLLTSEAFAFVQYVRLEEAGGPRMEAMAALPEFRHIPGFSVYPFTPLGTHSANRFFSSPHLTGLRHIDCRGVNPGVAGMQALAMNPALARLRKLSLHHNKLVDKAVAALAASPHLTNLVYLGLGDNNIGDAGAEALAASPRFANLHELNLRENPRLTDRGKKLLRDKFGDRVKLS